MSEKNSRYLIFAVSGAVLLIGASIFYLYPKKPEVDERENMMELMKKRGLLVAKRNGKKLGWIETPGDKLDTVYFLKLYSFIFE